MKPVAEFLPTPAQLLAVGDAWDRMTNEGRYALVVFGGKQGALSSYDKWADIPAQWRMELAHRLYLARDFFNRVLP